MTRDIEFIMPYYANLIPDVYLEIINIIESNQSSYFDDNKKMGKLCALVIPDTEDFTDSRLEEILVKYEIPYDILSISDDDMYEGVSCGITRYGKYTHGIVQHETVRNWGNIEVSKLKELTDVLFENIANKNLNKIEDIAYRIQELQKQSTSGNSNSVKEELEYKESLVNNSELSLPSGNELEIFKKISEQYQLDIVPTANEDMISFAEKIKRTLKDENPNVILPNRMNLLHMSAIVGSVPLFSAVLDLCDESCLTTTDDCGRYPLDYLVTNYELFSFYNDKNLPFHMLDSEGDSILQRVIQYKTPDHGCHLARDDFAKYENVFLRGDKSLQVCKDILETNKVDINNRNNKGATFLHDLSSKNISSIDISSRVSESLKLELIKLSSLKGGDVTSQIQVSKNHIITPLDVANDEGTKKLLLFLSLDCKNDTKKIGIPLNRI